MAVAIFLAKVCDVERGGWARPRALPVVGGDDNAGAAPLRDVESRRGFERDVAEAKAGPEKASEGLLEPGGDMAKLLMSEDDAPLPAPRIEGEAPCLGDGKTAATS